MHYVCLFLDSLVICFAYSLQKFLYAYSFPVFLQQILGCIAHNVPAVYDVLAARMRALRSKDQGWQNVPEQRRGNEA
jgi:hypothetical protein